MVLIEVGFRGAHEFANVGGYGKNLWQSVLSNRVMKQRERRRKKWKDRNERRRKPRHVRYIPGLVDTKEEQITQTIQKE